MTIAPTDLSGLLLWLKADQVSGNDGDSIATWSDQSGAGRDVTQATGALQPILKKAGNGINSQNVLRFNGSTQFLNRAGTGILQDVASSSIFVVHRLANTSQDGTASFQVSINGSGSARAGLYAGVSSNGLLTLRGRRLDADTAVNIGGGALTTGVKLVSQLWDWANTLVTIWEEGTQTGTNASFQTAGNTSNTASDEMAVGTANSGGGFCAVDIAEIILYVPKLATTDRQRIEWYLASTYAISGPTNPDAVTTVPAFMHHYKSMRR